MFFSPYHSSWLYIPNELHHHVCLLLSLILNPLVILPFFYFHLNMLWTWVSNHKHFPSSKMLSFPWENQITVRWGRFIVSNFSWTLKILYLKSFHSKIFEFDSPDPCDGVSTVLPATVPCTYSWASQRSCLHTPICDFMNCSPCTVLSQSCAPTPASVHTHLPYTQPPWKHHTAITSKMPASLQCSQYRSPLESQSDAEFSPAAEKNFLLP